MRWMSVGLILIALAGVAASGLPTLLFPPRSRAGSGLSALINLVASALGFAGLIACATNPESSNSWRINWALPVGRFAVGVDLLTVIFLLPIFLISALGAIYGLAY